ncbi:MAG: hypothetical protein ABIT37_11440 [Luteolibacter sp.]
MTPPATVFLFARSVFSPAENVSRNSGSVFHSSGSVFHRSAPVSSASLSVFPIFPVSDLILTAPANAAIDAGLRTQTWFRCPAAGGNTPSTLPKSR